MATDSHVNRPPSPFKVILSASVHGKDFPLLEYHVNPATILGRTRPDQESAVANALLSIDNALNDPVMAKRVRELATDVIADVDGG